MKNQSPFISILGGSFDPIHNGHLEMAQIAQESIQHSELYFVPCGHPVHRASSKTPAIHRLAMIKIALAQHVNVHVDCYEMNAPKPSYTIDTLQHFRQRFPNNPIGFIMGMDTFLTLDTAWGSQWQDLLNYAHLLVISRAAITSPPSPVLQDFLKQHQVTHQDVLHKQRYGAIMFLDKTPPRISSTVIREKIAQREDVSDLLPKGVYDYIQQHELYR